MVSSELELTYLVRWLPEGLLGAPSKLVVDVYFPATANHPCLRLRQNGDQYEMTKKSPVKDTDSSHQNEHTINLNEHEFNALAAAPGKRVAKQRYFYNYHGQSAEIDVFLEGLKGLVLADFEFDERGDQLAFKIPDFCLADVTQEAFVAGGKLAAKTYEDIEADLARYEYKPIY